MVEISKTRSHQGMVVAKKGAKSRAGRAIRVPLTDLLAQARLEDGPHFMPNRRWPEGRVLSADERLDMILWEQKYMRARRYYEELNPEIRGLCDASKGQVEPNFYVRWLQYAYHFFMQQPGLAGDTERLASYHQELKGARQSGYFHELHDQLPLGTVMLSVGRYKDRVKHLSRSYDVFGFRYDVHHLPRNHSCFVPHAHTGNPVQVPREYGIAVAIPWDIHSVIHEQRDLLVAGETLYQQVENDFDWLAPKLAARGYSDATLERARIRTHAMNRTLTFRPSPRDSNHERDDDGKVPAQTIDLYEAHRCLQRPPLVMVKNMSDIDRLPGMGGKSR